MFTLPGKPNTGANILASIANTSVEGQLERNREARKNESIKEAFSKLNEESSPLDFYRAISGIQGLDDNEKKLLYQIPEKLSETRKLSAVNQERANQLQKQQSALTQYAKKMGIDPSEVPEGLDFNQSVKLIDAASKQKKEADESARQQLEVKAIDKLSKKLPLTPEEQASLSPTSAREQSRLDQQRPPFESESEKLLAKQQFEFRSEALQGYKAAKEAKGRLAEQVRLAKSGKLSTPLMVKALDTIGVPLSVLQNPDTEEYRKLEFDWLKDAKNYFPGQVRTFEAQSFLKSIPGLMISDKGKIAVAKYLDAQADAKILVYDTIKQIIKENGGKVPDNLDFETYDRIGDRLSDFGAKAKEAIDEAENLGPKLRMYDKNGRAYDIPSNNPEAIQAAMDQQLRFSK